MAPACKLTNAMVKTLATTLATSIGNNSAAKIYIFSGGVPTDADSASGTTLVTMTMSATAFGVVGNDASSNALLTANAIGSCTTAVGGTASYFRVYTGGSTCIVQGICDTSSGDMIMNTLTIAASATVQASAYTITVPRG